MVEHYMKRVVNLIQVVVIISIMAVSTITTSMPAFATPFSDLENHWAKSYIDMVSAHQVVSGYADGSFKPNKAIQRIEFIAIIVNAQGLVTRTPEIGEYWGQPYIEAALQSGLIVSNEYGTMDALTFSKNITREEMASIVVNAYIYSGGLMDSRVLNEVRTKLSDFDTVSPNYKDNAIASVALDFISGYSDGTFAPKNSANRAQAAVLSYKLLVKLGTITDALPENIILSKNKIKQGDLLTLSIYHVTSPTTIELVQNLYPEFKWFDAGGVIKGVIPTNYSTKPGVYALKFTNKETGNTSTRTIEIAQRDFRVQRLTIDTRIESSTKTDEGYAQYRKYFNPSRDISSPVPYYTEPFLLPTSGKLTTEFGESRYVNGVLTTYRHAGIDIAAPRNADVLSANTGKVVLAMPLIITGNSIVIDHGEGLFSVYFHLDKSFVAKGEMVKRGQLIGAVGSTGFSTGPHLHFTMSYYRFDIEPGFILYGESITKGNYLELMK